MTPLQVAHACLVEHHGFTRQNPALGDWPHVYRGTVDVEGTKVAVDVVLCDVNLIDLPLVRLCDPIPNPWNQPCTHISTQGYVCYARAGEAHVKPWDVHGGIAGVLEGTRALLARLRAGDPLAEAHDDFPADWATNKVYVDLPPELEAGFYRDGVWLFSNGNAAPVLTRDDPEARARYESVGFDQEDVRAFVRVVDVKQPPRRQPDPWPPENLYELDDWLAATERAAIKPLGELLTSDRENSALRVLIVRSPTHWYVAYINTKWIPRSAWRGHGQERYRRLTQRLGRRIPIGRFNVDQVHPDAWISRNLGREVRGLSGYRVAVLGCGAIGGYAAQGLGQLGAGQGGGRLYLLDSDALQWGNLGRHLLGAKSMGQNKASAVAALLRASYPGIDVDPVADHVTTPEQLPRVDLVVDATGHDPLSFHLALWQREGQFRALVSAWVAGSGVAAQALLQCDRQSACVGCVRAVSPGHAYSALPAGYTPTHEQAPGCLAPHVPYAAAAAVHAAALVSELALEFSQGWGGPRYRSVPVVHSEAYSVISQSPQRRADCPLCAH